MYGLGFAYTVDAWTWGGGYAHVQTEVAGFNDDSKLDRAGFTANYSMAPGIDLDAGIFYTWNEEADDSDTADGYDAFQSARHRSRPCRFLQMARTASEQNGRPVWAAVCCWQA